MANGEGSPPGLWTAALSSVLTCPLLCVHVESELFIQGHQSYRLRGSPFWPHLILITSFEASSPNTAMLGIRASTYEFGAGVGVGTDIQSIHGL